MSNKISTDTAFKEKKERLAKRIAHLGYCSRREAEKLILEKKVKVNGLLIDTPAFVVSNKDKIVVEGMEAVEEIGTKLYLYYKPRGLVCSKSDEMGRPTIYDYLPQDLPRLVYVGRLDINSEGLLLLTNNGDLSNILTSPHLALKRVYKVRAYGRVNQTMLDDLALGIQIEGIYYKPIVANLIKRQKDNSWIEFVVSEGKNREIRKVCEYLGLQVNRLIRTSFGSYYLEGLREGEIREVNLSSLKPLLSKEDFNKFAIKNKK